MTASALRRRPLALPAPRPGWTPRRAELPAWAGSLLLHGLAAGALLGLVGLSRPPGPPAPIAVELVLREAPPEPAPAASAPEPAAPEPAPPTPVESAPEPPPIEAPVPAPSPVAARPPPRLAAPRNPAPPRPPRPQATPARDATAAAPPAIAPSTPAAPEPAPVFTTARFRQRPAPPDYPEMARERGQTGTAVIRVLVSPQGETREVRLHRSSGHALLDGAAVQAVRRWLFEPATRDGRALEAWVEVPVRFQLD